jgi:hypothetical protein
LRALSEVFLRRRGLCLTACGCRRLDIHRRVPGGLVDGLPISPVMRSQFANRNSSLFMPLQSLCNHLRRLTTYINTMLQNPQALDKPQMRVIYVQFGDGTDWGDKTVGMSLRAKRPILTAALNSWLAAYRRGGDTALQEALGNEPTYFCRGSSFKRSQYSSNVRYDFCCCLHREQIGLCQD